MPKREMNRRGSAPNHPILDGHVRNKKKLIPPMLGFSQTTFISTIDTIFPEIVWIGLLLDWHGLRDGTELVSRILRQLWTAQKDTNWYRLSEIAAHGDDLTRILDEEEIAEAELAFATIRLVYDWPGLDWARSHEDRPEAERRTETTIRKYADRFDQPYLLMAATIIYSMAISDKMKFAPGTVPNIEAIASNWGSDEAEMAACSVRACSMAFFPHDSSELSEEWCKHFWRRNYQMSSCELNDHTV